MDYVSLLIGVLVGGAIGFLLAKLMKGESTTDSSSSDNTTLNALQSENERLATARMELDKDNGILQGQVQANEGEIAALKMKQAQERENREKLIAENADWKARYASLEEKLEAQKSEIEQLQKKFTTEFENVANKILDQNSKKFTEKNEENLKGILDPLKTKIKEFEEKVDKTYRRENEERISLKTELKHLMDLNKQLSDDATNLASALKGDNKTQGDWGELQLELILEKAGLQKGTHYTTQSTFKDEEGSNRRPDCIINLPEGKHLIIDSKMSLTAYSSFFQAESSEERAMFLKSHIASIDGHIRKLAGSNYKSLYGINSPDYILMFIPIESAFSLALQHDDQLFLRALNRDIVLVTTSTLLATMRTVSFIWKQEDQKENVLDIAKQSGKLYDKFVLFIESLNRIGISLDKAKEEHTEAVKRLYDGKDNLIRKVERIKDLGAKTTKALPAEMLKDAGIDNEDQDQGGAEEKSKLIEEATSAEEIQIDETTPPDA